MGVAALDKNPNREWREFKKIDLVELSRKDFKNGNFADCNF